MPRRGLEPPRPKGTGPQPAAYAIPPPGLERLHGIIQPSPMMSIPERGIQINYLLFYLSLLWL